MTVCFPNIRFTYTLSQLLNTLFMNIANYIINYKTAAFEIASRFCFFFLFFFFLLIFFLASKAPQCNYSK